jgi:hypothetical protein
VQFATNSVYWLFKIRSGYVVCLGINTLVTLALCTMCGLMIGHRTTCRYMLLYNNSRSCCCLPVTAVGRISYEFVFLEVSSALYMKSELVRCVAELTVS